MKSFKDKVAVVTGGGGDGIGNALVKALAREGAHVAFCDIKAIDKTLEETKDFPVRVYGAYADVGDKASLKEFMANVIKEFGVVDILINNAGIATGDRSYEQLTDEDFEKITDINYWGVIRCTQALYPILINRPEAAIVNISSTQGILAAPFLVPYCTTKFAVRGFSDSLRVEHQIRNIKNLTIHTVHPGAVATNISLNADYQGEKTQNFHELLQRRGAKPDKAAEIILKGIRKKKSRIFISDGRVQDIIARLFPSGIHHVIRLVMKNQKLRR